MIERVVDEMARAIGGRAYYAFNEEGEEYLVIECEPGGTQLDLFDADPWTLPPATIPPPWITVIANPEYL